MPAMRAERRREGASAAQQVRREHLPEVCEEVVTGERAFLGGRVRQVAGDDLRECRADSLDGILRGVEAAGEGEAEVFARLLVADAVPLEQRERPAVCILACSSGCLASRSCRSASCPSSATPAWPPTLFGVLQLAGLLRFEHGDLLGCLLLLQAPLFERRRLQVGDLLRELGLPHLLDGGEALLFGFGGVASCARARDREVALPLLFACLQ